MVGEKNLEVSGNRVLDPALAAGRSHASASWASPLRTEQQMTRDYWYPSRGSWAALGSNNPPSLLKVLSEPAPPVRYGWQRVAARRPSLPLI